MVATFRANLLCKVALTKYIPGVLIGVNMKDSNIENLFYPLFSFFFFFYSVS